MRLMRHLLLIIAALWGAATPLSAAGKKQPYLVSFHEEGDKEEGVRKVQEAKLNGKTYYFRKQPLITHSNFRAYWPFPADDGQTWGAVFWLDTGGQHALQRLGGQRDQYLAAAVNRMPVDFQYIDEAPTDGRIVIWKNLSPQLFEMMDKEKRVRRIGGTTDSGPYTRGGTRRQGDGAPLPEGAVVGNIDGRTLDSATRGLAPAPRPARSTRAPRPAAAGAPPFSPDNSQDRPDLTPLTEPRSSR